MPHDPESGEQVNMNRGFVHFSFGRFKKASADLERARDLWPDDTYVAIWLYLAREHQDLNGESDLRAHAITLDLVKWPGPVVKMFLGEFDAQSIAYMGEANATQADKVRRTEAYFYAGQQELLVGNNHNARRFFETALETGVFDLIEYNGAKQELNRMASNQK